MDEVFKALDVDMRLLCGMRTRPADAGMLTFPGGLFQAVTALGR
jgi:hypothetical protein